MAKNTTVELTLDEKIAKALGLPSATSSAPLLTLIIETTAAIEVEDETSRTARAHAVDPRALDGVASRGKAEDSEFRAARYRAGLRKNGPQPGGRSPPTRPVRPMAGLGDRVLGPVCFCPDSVPLDAGP
jgi:hypothetical protein